MDASGNQVDGKSFVQNCLMIPKDQDNPMFDTVTVPGHVLARLDGYAVIPMEEWRRLRTAAGEAVD